MNRILENDFSHNPPEQYRNFQGWDSTQPQFLPPPPAERDKTAEARQQIKLAILAAPELAGKRNRKLRSVALQDWWHAGTSGKSFTFHATLARECGCSERTVMRWRKFAACKNWLQIHRRPNTSAAAVWEWSPEYDTSTILEVTRTPSETRFVSLPDGPPPLSEIPNVQQATPVQFSVPVAEPGLLAESAPPPAPTAPAPPDKAVLQAASKAPLSDNSVRTFWREAKGDTEALEAWAWDRRHDPLNHGGGIVRCIRDGEVSAWRRKIDHARQLEAEAATREAEWQALQARTEAPDPPTVVTTDPPPTIALQPTEARNCHIPQATEAHMSTPPARMPRGVKDKIDELETLAWRAATPEIAAQHQAEADALRSRYERGPDPPGVAAPPEAAPARQDQAEATWLDLAKFVGTVN